MSAEPCTLPFLQAPPTKVQYRYELKADINFNMNQIPFVKIEMMAHLPAAVTAINFDSGNLATSVRLGSMNYLTGGNNATESVTIFGSVF